MIISDNNISQDRLLNNPIFVLTGDVETTKFFSNLASACIKFGYYIEQLIVDQIKLPIMSEIAGNTLFDEKEYILVKPKFGSEIPDIVFVNEIEKIIDVYEIKTNLRNADSKKAHGEKLKYKRLYDYLTSSHKDYKIRIFVVDFMGSLLGATVLYKESKIIEVIDGKQFCEKIYIDHSIIIEHLQESQKKNKEFINYYKNLIT
jgi:hypothetical protein